MVVPIVEYCYGSETISLNTCQWEKKRIEIEFIELILLSITLYSAYRIINE